MNFLISIRTELIKNRRTAAFWLSFIGAAMIPFLFFLMYMIKPHLNYERYSTEPWTRYLTEAWQGFAFFLLPMFVILICSLIPQIEFKNNTWKQVFASPQTIGNIFFSKYISILIMIVSLFIFFNIFMILSAIIPNLFYPKFKFLSSPIDWASLAKLNIKIFTALLGIIAIQYWLGLRFKNFIAPIGIGMGLLVMSVVAHPWEHIDKVPYAFPFLTFMISAGERPQPHGFFSNHELNSMVWFVCFTLLAFADMRYRKQRG